MGNSENDLREKNKKYIIEKYNHALSKAGTKGLL